MSTVSLRKAAGLSIRDLAELMEVSHSAVGHYEKGWRHLPTTGSVRYAQLQQAWLAFCRNEEKPAVVFTELRKQQLAQTIEALEKEQADADFQIEALNRLLKPMQKRYQKLKVKLLFIQVLKNAEDDRCLEVLIPDEKSENKEARRRKQRMLFLQVKEDDALNAMKFCGPEKQEKLVFRLELAKAKQKLAGKALAKLTKQFGREQ